MAKNDVVLLDKVFEAGRVLAPSDLDDGSYFELFVAEQVLKAWRSRSTAAFYATRRAPCAATSSTATHATSRATSRSTARSRRR